MLLVTFPLWQVIQMCLLKSSTIIIYLNKRQYLCFIFSGVFAFFFFLFYKKAIEINIMPSKYEAVVVWTKHVDRQ